MNKFLSTIFLLLFLNINSQDLKLPSIFGDNMILQQNSSAPVWGWSKKDKDVTINVSWNDKLYSTKSNSEGKWMINIDTPEYGGPYQFSVSSIKQTVTFKNVLIGEVWIASGQSNMEMPLNGFNKEPVFGSLDMIAKSTNSNIRLFTVEKKTSKNPLENLNGKWLISNPKNTSTFSAVAYSYANYLNDVLGVPLGVINTPWGGTPAEAWTDEKTLTTNFDKSEIKNHRNLPQHEPSNLFNAMINPLIPYKIKGVIWYQGEGNVARANNYDKLMNKMIEGWRREWNQDAFSFYFVQLAPFKYGGNDKPDSAFLREAQLKTMLNTVNSGMVVTLDIGSEHTIHPPEKILIGKRLAYWALAKDYKIEGISFSGPVYKSLDIKGDKVIVNFDYAERGVTSYNNPIINFEIAGSDRIFHSANARVIRGYGGNRSKLEVSSNKVKEPVAVRYGWKNFLKGNLYNTQGLPASSFRSDSW